MDNWEKKAKELENSFNLLQCQYTHVSEAHAKLAQQNAELFHRLETQQARAFKVEDELNQLKQEQCSSNSKYSNNRGQDNRYYDKRNYDNNRRSYHNNSNYNNSNREHYHRRSPP